MRYTRAVAVAIGTFMLILPSAYMVSAKTTGHDEGDLMIITMPPSSGSISCAVYFADNMVFAPQWRTDGQVRIEMMIINMTDFGGDPRAIENGTINLAENEDISYETEYPDYMAINPDTEADYWDQQSFLFDDSDRLNLTSMVSVSYICVTVTEVLEQIPLEDPDYIPYSDEFEAGWLTEDHGDDEAYDRVIHSELGREVNKHGNLIYGMLWDTSGNGGSPAAPAGEYRVDVQLGMVGYDETVEGGYFGAVGTGYTVDFAVGHLYIGDGELLDDAHPYVSLVPSIDLDKQIDIGEGEEEVLVWLYQDLAIGLGGASNNKAWILLGQLMAQGPGGGNGGDSGGTGKGHCGDKSHLWQGSALQNPNPLSFLFIS
ncbi:MAG: hypothetical protein IH630_02290 [Thermoplasmata archaeon]|nr:hypothetical protein [Thermoplasmata archaeon]TFG70142.1 MAG: hypothetical protein E4H25_02975 [Methanomassiliicoccus sp.]